MLLSCVLLALALLPLPPPVNPSVDSSFRECSQFLYRSLAPRGLQRTQGLQKVCQYYGDKARYATLYDGSHRLPLYSAYTFKKNDGKKRMDTPWMYEPQVEICYRVTSQQVERDLQQQLTVILSCNDAVFYRNNSPILMTYRPMHWVSCLCHEGLRAFSPPKRMI